MQRTTLLGLAFLCHVGATGLACTQDYGAFEIGSGGGSASARGQPSGSGSGASSAGGDASSSASGPGSTSGGGGALSCPCDIANGQSGCEDGMCTIESCDAGHDDCNDVVADGCEIDSSSDDANCGGCQNRCSDQGYSGGFVCQDTVCRCTSDAQCKGNGNGTATCDLATGQCACQGTACQAGESCVKSGPNQVCRCNGGAACEASQVCCDEPSGCTDLMSDAASCGACGHACGPGLSCQSGVCG